MSASGYKGESPGKKLARLTFWTTVRTWLGEKEFLRGRHLVLASAEGGDVAVLLGMGVEARNIIACDLDPGAVAAFRSKFPEVLCHRANVADVAHEHRGLATACLDFCGEATDATLMLARRVQTRALATGGVLGLCFQRGRERPVDQARSRALQLSARYKQAKRTNPGHTGGSDLSRAFACLEFLIQRTDHRSMPMCQLVINYHSRTRNGAGVPMTMFPIWLVPQSVAAEALAERLHAPHIAEFTYLTEWQLRAKLLAVIERDFAGAQPVTAARLANVEPATLAAWRAHLSRGTYRGLAAE